MRCRCGAENWDDAEFCHACGASLRADERKPHAPPETTVECPKCNGIVEVLSRKRPLTITCPRCGARFILRSEHGLRKKAQVRGKIDYWDDWDEISRDLRDVGDKLEYDFSFDSLPKGKDEEKKNEVRVECPNCHHRVIVHTDRKEFKIKCKRCGKNIEVSIV